MRGKLPPEIAFLRELEVLNIGDNKISGNVPMSLGSLVGITHLELYRNQFDGPIDHLSELTNLRVVDLSKNDFTGSLATSGNWTQLEAFNVSANRFSGPVPEALAQVPSLGMCLELKQ